MLFYGSTPPLNSSLRCRVVISLRRTGRIVWCRLAGDSSRMRLSHFAVDEFLEVAERFLAAEHEVALVEVARAETALD